jgi:hypothetical protein
MQRTINLASISNLGLEPRLPSWMTAVRLCHTREIVLKIQRSSNGQVTYMLSGEIEEQDIAELEALIRSEAKGSQMVLDLRNLTLAGRDAIAFLNRCEANGITLKNCPAYIREWMKGQRS